MLLLQHQTMSTIPFWQLNPNNSGLVLDRVQLFLWAKGICVAGHNAEGKLIAARAYQSEEVYDPQLLEHVILNDPLLADADLVEKVWMGVSRNMIFPEAFANKEVCDPWFEKFYFKEHDEELATSSAPDFGVKIIYPKKKQLRSMLGQYFPNRKSRFIIAPQKSLAWFSSNSVYRVMVLMMGESCSLTFFEKEKFVHFSILTGANAEDIISYIGNYWINLHHISEIELAVTGISARIETMYEGLSQYLSRMSQAPDSKQLLELLSQCA